MVHAPLRNERGANDAKSSAAARRHSNLEPDGGLRRDRVMHPDRRRSARHRPGPRRPAERNDRRTTWSPSQRPTWKGSCGDPGTPIHVVQGMAPPARRSPDPRSSSKGSSSATTRAARPPAASLLQEEDADADGDPTTSEGIFVFTAAVTLPPATGSRPAAESPSSRAVLRSPSSTTSPSSICGSGDRHADRGRAPVAGLGVLGALEGMLSRSTGTDRHRDLHARALRRGRAVVGGRP